MLKKTLMVLVTFVFFTACSSTKYKTSYPNHGIAENLIYDGTPMAEHPGDEPGDSLKNQ